jgi:hypothetical protein
VLWAAHRIAAWGAGAAWQVCYTLDVAQYAIGAGPETNFFYSINKALQKRDPGILVQLSGSPKTPSPSPTPPKRADIRTPEALLSGLLAVLPLNTVSAAPDSILLLTACC